MIEINLKPGGEESTQESLGWVQASAQIEVFDINFDRTKVRVNGVVYTVDSDQFREAFKRAKLWMTLQDD